MNAALQVIQRKSAIRRTNAFRAIFDKLKGREFSVEDVAEAIGMTHSGTRRYRRELLELGLMTETGNGSGNFASYVLAEDQGDIDAFLELVAAGERLVAPIHPNKPRAEVQQRPAPVPVPFVARRDPMVAALFGPARAAVGGV